MVMLHGYDFVAIGDPKHLEATEVALRSKYKIKTQTLGCGIEDKKEVIVLNNVVHVNGNCFEREADPRQNISSESSVYEFASPGSFQEPGQSPAEPPAESSTQPRRRPV